MNNKFETDDYEILTNCPWCHSSSNEQWGKPVRGFDSVRCKGCGLIYVKNRLNSKGLEKYYSVYFKEIHQSDEILNQQREQMYDLEFSLIHKYIKNKSVLDVGCSGGFFLDRFYQKGNECYGVEFSKTAARIAGQRHIVYHGDFANMNFDRKFDLIVFRGVIEHIPYPKTYLDKAIKLLNTNGLIYLTSTPNADSFCCNLFEEQFNQHEPEAHLIHFRPVHFDEYFTQNGFQKLLEYKFYEETPYASLEEDILKVAEAIKLKKTGKSIDFISPAFWGNMMSLIYKKI